MKNIAILCRALNTGGAERIAGLLSKELSKKYNVYLFLLEAKEIVYEYSGILVDIESYGPYYETTIRAMKLQLQIDVAISFLGSINFENLRTRGRERVIISERSTIETMFPRMATMEHKIRKYYNTADAIVACSKGVRHSLMNTYGIDENIITTIYNFIDKDTILKKASSDLDKSTQAFLNGSEYFVCVGRLHPVKNQERLIRQFFHFHKQDIRRIRLLIIGSGEMQNELCDLIDNLDLQDFVRIISYNENPFQYMVRAKALILPSYSEGLPNVILEAMIVQCPVIATDCLSGPRELLKGTEDYQEHVARFEVCKRGILVCNDLTEDNGNTHFMADAMRWVCENNLEEIRVNQAEYMSEYTNEQILRQWIEVIEKADKKTIDIYEAEKKLIDTAEHVYIYGAGKHGIEVYEHLKNNFAIEAFVVTRKGMQKNNILGLPVKELDDVLKGSGEAVFIVAAAGKNQDEIIDTLRERAIDNIVLPFN